MYWIKSGLIDNDSRNYLPITGLSGMLQPIYREKEQPMQDCFEAIKIRKEKQSLSNTDFVV